MNNRIFSHPTEHKGQHDMSRAKSSQSKYKSTDEEKRFKNLDQIDKHTETGILLDQYKLVANSYESIQQRRIANNNVFIFIYSAIIGVYNLLASDHVPMSDKQLSYSIYTIFVLGMLVGVMWFDMILSNINSEKAKYKVLLLFENHMPFRIYSKTDNKIHGENKTLSPRYMELSLPLFMMLTLALNFYFMMFT